MTKEDIIKILQGNDKTIMSFPERGPWGDSRYRGNTSGFIPAFLIWKYGIKKLAEVFAGSGTSSDVCKTFRELGISDVSYVGVDLNPNPPRGDIIGGFDAFTLDVPDAFRGADMVFMHPPYGKEINIPYAGSMYPDPTGELSRRDLGQMPWNTFMEVLNTIVMKYYAALDKGSFMAVLMGDVRRNGFHSMLSDIVKPGELQQLIIKQQNNFSSRGKLYSRKNFVPIVHEYIMVLKKVLPYLVDFTQPMRYEVDIRDSEDATWTDVVYAVLKDKASLPLGEIYSLIEGFKKTRKNPHWREKVRQTLYTHSCFTSDSRGVWKVV